MTGDMGRKMLRVRFIKEMPGVNFAEVGMMMQVATRDGGQLFSTHSGLAEYATWLEERLIEMAMETLIPEED